MPFVAYATGLALEGSSLWEFTTTATGCADVTVTAYCAPSASPGSIFGSTNCDCPDAIARMTVSAGPPPKGLKVAVATVVVGPRFWMMNGVWKPKKRRTMFGRNTVVAPVLAPT